MELSRSLFLGIFVRQIMVNASEMIGPIYDGFESRVLGVPLFAGDGPELLRRIGKMIQTGRPHLVVTPNVDQLIELGENEQFRHAFATADMAIIDGMPVLHLARSVGDRALKRFTGADLLPRVVAHSASSDWRVVIAGGDDSISNRAVQNLRSLSPGSHVTSIPFPFITDIDEDPSVFVGALADCRPDVVFLCLGSPKQELWISRWSHVLPPAVYVGAGAAVDFAAGRLSRAPMWVQKMSIEWIWRLMSEPGRLWRRYLVRGPRFISTAVTAVRANFVLRRIYQRGRRYW